MSVKAIRNLIDELREDRQLERIGPAKEGTGKCCQKKHKRGNHKKRPTIL